MMSTNLYSCLVVALAAAATAAVAGCAVGESADDANALDPAVESAAMPCEEAKPPANDEGPGDDSSGGQYQYPAENQDEGASGGAPQGNYGAPQGGNGAPQGNYGAPQGNYGEYAGGNDDSAGGYGPMSGTYYNQSVTIQTFGPAGSTPVGYSAALYGAPYGGYGGMGYSPYGGSPCASCWRGGY
jgi:hypothetical protein